MRRLASLFVSKKDSDPVQTTPTSPPRSSKRKTFTINTDPNLADVRYASPDSLSPGTPQLRSDSVPSAQSSMCSESNGLRTPDDELHPSHHSPTTPKASVKSKRSLFSWLPSKKGDSLRQPIPHWPSSQQSTTNLQLPLTVSGLAVGSDDGHVQTTQYLKPQHTSFSLPNIRRMPPVMLPMESAKQNLEILTANCLVERPHSSPCHRCLGSPSFPRSCHSSRSLPRRATLEISMHRRCILRKLDTLSDEELSSIAPFANLPLPPAPQLQSESDIDEARPEPSRVSLISTGLEWWLYRPCFEARNLSWLPIEGQIVTQQVSGTKFGVPDLEFSPWAEHLAGLVDELPPSSSSSSSSVVVAATTAQPQVHLSITTTSLTPSTTAARRSSQTTQPSPLRQEHAPPTASAPTPTSSMQKPTIEISPLPSPPSPQSSLASPQTPSVSITPPSAPTPAVKRGVRFAEDDKEDQIPLGYVLRQKQQKAQKAQFLQEERERRRFAQEQAKVEEERRQREEERQQWERERRDWEAEKRKAVEEKKARMLAEEVKIARARRESQRAGFFGRNSNPGNAFVMGPSYSTTSISSTEDRGQYGGEGKILSRPVYDPPTRRMASEPAVPTALHPHSESPGSSDSRASSVAGYSQSHSRPPSMHSTPMSSLEDVGPSNRKRRSLAASDRPPSFCPPSTWMPNQQNVMMVPFVPAMPGYLIPVDNSNMPLLPPTPPFFGDSRSRSRSRNSSSGSSRNSKHSSSEALHRIQQQHTSSSQNRRSTYSNASNSSSHLPQVPPSPSHSVGFVQSPSFLLQDHQRRSSGDFPQRPRAAERASFGGMSAKSASSMRGRPTQSAFQPPPPLPSPWTAPPSQQDLVYNRSSRR